MKVNLWVLGMVILAGCTAESLPENNSSVLETVPAQEFRQLVDSMAERSVILDVRRPEEFAQGYIEGAELVDFYSESFKDSIENLDRQQTYLVYCRSGYRSGVTLDMMEEAGFTSVYELDGGFNGWKANGYPVS